MKTLHIVAGLVSLLAGAIALYAAKGSPAHRRAGLAFSVAMLTMTSSALLIAVLFRPNIVNVIAATLTFYLVCTGFMAVTMPLPRTRAASAGLMLVACAVGVASLALAIEAGRRGARVDGIPTAPLYMFGVVALVAAAGDLRWLRAGGVVGGPRLLRHLWRMSYAMWIATMSFFLGQAKFIPQPLRKLPLLVIPVLLVLAVMLYWIWRVRKYGVRAPARDPQSREKARGGAAEPRPPRRAPYSSSESMLT